ncbi:MAG TPA: AAA family ATPase, partial [Acidimicrobiia bacterium]|nr:AAA family ATPase [Acidimicrobiia bacterium]
MSSQDFRGIVTELLRARHPLLLIETHEEERVIEELDAIAADPALRTQRVVYEWTATRGLVRRGAREHQATRLPAAALEHVVTRDEAALFVFRDLHPFLGTGNRPPDVQVVRLLRDIANRFRAASNPACLVMVSPVASLPPDLEKVVTIVDFPLPDEAEMRRLLDRMIEMNRARGGFTADVDDTDRERLARAATGLTLAEAENAFARAMVSTGTLRGDDIDIVIEEKRQTIRRSALLEFVSTDLTLSDIGGLDNLKSWLAKREGAWSSTAKDWGIPDPKGVLIAGVPGCGKSLTAKCVAETWGLPLLRLDVGRVFSGLVGSSEQNMR